MTKKDKEVFAKRLVNCLIAIRTGGYSINESLEYILKIEGKFDLESQKALLIYLTEYFLGKGNDADIILMALGLLNGYENERRIGKRRTQFLKESSFIEDLYRDSIDRNDIEKNMHDALALLPKREEALFKKLALGIITIENINDFIKDVSKRPIYPYPSYFESRDKSEAIPSDHVSVIHIVTPNVPRWENTNILGRDALVRGICNELNIGVPHLQLTGMGGLGKSEILHKVYLSFVEKKIPHSFQHIGLLYYDGFSNSSLIQQLDFQGTESSEDAWSYLRKLCDQVPTLLLIDDIRPQQAKKDKVEEPDNFFAKLFSLKATVLLASRTLLEKFDNRKVQPLPIEVCIRIFLNQKSGDNPSQSPASLSKKELKLTENIIKYRAGYNTLIVNRLGVIAREYKWDIQTLSDKLDNKGFDMVKGCDSEEKLQEEINKLYSLGDIKSSAERSLLEAFAIFPVIPLQQDTCIKWLQEDAGIDEDFCRLTLNRLSKQTWLTSYTGEVDSYSMHQMVKSAVITQVKINFEKHIKLITLCSNDIQFSKEKTFISAKSSIPFAISLAEYFHSEKRTELADLMNNIGRYLEESANFDQALAWHHKACSIKEELLGFEHPDTATSYHNIARVHDNKGEYDLALEWNNKALKIRERVLGFQHPDTADSYQRIGFALSRSKYKESMKNYVKALKIRKNVYGKDNLITDETYHSIAGIYTRTGNYRRALILYHSSLRNRNNKLDENHPLIALTYSCIAQVYIRKKNYPESLVWDRKALEIRKEVLAPDHPDTATTYNHIAKAYTNLGEYPKALEQYKAVIEMRERRIGTEHPHTATTYNDLGELHYTMKDYEKALKWYKKAFRVRKKELGLEAAPTASSYYNLAKTFEILGYQLRAQILFLRSLNIRKKALGENHLSTADSYVENARINALRGNQPRALKYYNEALGIYVKKEERSRVKEVEKAILILNELAL